MTRFPFGHPRGWYLVAYTGEVAAGEVRPLRCFGEDLVLYRGEGGDAVVLDGYCAHLGAHLGVGGVVRGDTIECPFHAWRYEPTGRCVAVPKAKKLPQKAKLRAWPVHETNGCIHLWYHPGQRPPDFDVPTLEQWRGGKWRYRKTFHWAIRTHPQEILENAIDFSHFETWANLYQAYEELSAGTRELVDRLWWIPMSTQATAYRVGMQAAKEDVAKQGTKLESEVRHPVVRTHPITRRKALWVSTFTVRVEGLDSPGEEEALTTELKSHVKQEHLFTKHEWTPHDVVIWDNRCVNHWREGWDPRYRRTMHRSQAGAARPF